MLREKTLTGTFAACSNEGSFTPLAKIDADQVRAMLTVALADLDTLNELRKKAPETSKQWNAIYKLAYDVLHTISESFLVFDKTKARTHECVFAYLCEKHPELEFDWSFFEKVRTVRNRSLYYGEAASYKHWKEVELQMNLYINTLKKAIETQLKVHS